MGKLREMLPIINIFDWAKGDKYTSEDNSDITLTPELADSLKEIEDKYETNHVSPKGKAGKGRSKYKVDASQLNQNNEGKVVTQSEKGKEDMERE